MSKRKNRPAPSPRLAAAAAQSDPKAERNKAAAATAKADPTTTAIANALDLLASTPATDVGAVRRTFKLASEALEAAKAKLDEQEAQLDSVTGPDLDLAKQNRQLRGQLDDSRVRQIELEQKLTFLQADLETDRTLLAEEKKRAKDFEKKTQTFEDVLMKDDDAFDRYFQAQLEAQERKGKQPPKR